MEGAPNEAADRFVGRYRELGRIESYLDDALGGRGRFVLCTGEAGIGKTRLAEEGALAPSARGITVAWARATDRDSSPPFGLWRFALTTQDAGGLDLSDVFERADPPALSEGLDAASTQRFAMFADVFRRLAGAAERGLLVVLDDLQWVYLEGLQAAAIGELLGAVGSTPAIDLLTSERPSPMNGKGL